MIILRQRTERKEERLPQTHDHRTTGSIHAAKGILSVLVSTIPSASGRNRGDARLVGIQRNGDRYWDRRSMPTKIRAYTNDGMFAVKVIKGNRRRWYSSAVRNQGRPDGRLHAERLPPRDSRGRWRQCSQEAGPQRRTRNLAEIMAWFDTEDVGLDASERLSREGLYGRCVSL